MRKDPSPESLASCMDGIGANIEDATERLKPVDQSIASRKYTVRYLIPTVHSSAFEEDSVRTMRVAGNSARDAVLAVKAAHPDADIQSVD